MEAFSVAFCKKKVEIWSEAEDAVASGQSYQIANRSLTRADLRQISDRLEYWLGKLAEAEAAESGGGGRNRVYQFLPRDV